MKALNSRLIFNSMSAAIEFKGIVQMFKLSAHLSALLIKCPNPYVVTLISAGLTVQSDGRGRRLQDQNQGLLKSLSLSITHFFFMSSSKAQVCHLVLFWWAWTLAAVLFCGCCFFNSSCLPVSTFLAVGQHSLSSMRWRTLLQPPKTIWIAWLGNDQ